MKPERVLAFLMRPESHPATTPLSKEKKSRSPFTLPGSTSGTTHRTTTLSESISRLRPESENAFSGLPRAWPKHGPGPSLKKTEPDLNGVRLGIYTVAADRGLGIERVVFGSAAESAALRSGDIILTFAGKFIRSLTQLRSLTAELEPGSRARIKFLRRGRRRTAREMEATLQF